MVDYLDGRCELVNVGCKYRTLEEYRRSDISMTTGERRAGESAQTLYFRSFQLTEPGIDQFSQFRLYAGIATDRQFCSCNCCQLFASSKSKYIHIFPLAPEDDM